MAHAGISEELLARVENIREKISGHRHQPTLLQDVLDKRRLNSSNRKLLKHVAKNILPNYGTSTSPEEILQQILADFTKANYVNHRVSAS